MPQHSNSSSGAGWLSLASTSSLWRTFRHHYFLVPDSKRHRFWIRLVIGLLLSMAICAAITVAGKWLGNHGMTQWDQSTLAWIVEEMPLFTFYDATIFESFGNLALTVPALLLTVIIASRRGAPFIAVGMVLGYLLLRPLIYLGWWLWDRARPELVAEGIASPPLHSFPSGHATISIFFYGFLGWLWWRATRSSSERLLILVLLAILLFLIGWARLRLGTHWPSDIVAGLVIGGSWLGCVIWSISGTGEDASVPEEQQ